MCLNAESLIICFIPGFLSFILASPSRCPHACGRTWGRPAEAYPTRGHIKTILWPLARNRLSWLKGAVSQTFFVPPAPVCDHSKQRCLCASTSDHSVTRYKQYHWGSHVSLLSRRCPQTQLPRILRMCFKDTHLNFYLQSEMPLT